MSRMTPIAAAAVLAVSLSLAACGSDSDLEADAISTSTSTVTQAGTPSKQVSKSDAVVQKVTRALDELGIKHAKPKRAEVELSGAQMRFDMPVNGYDAGINIFPNGEALAKWQAASDSFGGIHVALADEYAVLTLNSSEGIANSAEIAPRIAEAVGGTAHGV